MAAPLTDPAETTPAKNLSVDALTSMFRKGPEQPQPADAPPASEHAETAEAGADEALSQTADSAETTETTADAAAPAETPPETSDPDLEAAQAEAKGKGAVNRLLKRVNELTKQRNAANARAELAEQRLTERKEMPADEPADPADGPTPTPAPTPDAPALAKIDAQVASLKEAVKWCKDHPDGGELAENGQTVAYDSDRVTAIRERAEAMIETLRERRLETAVELKQQFRAQREQANTQASKLYPWLANPGSPDYQLALAVVRENPGLQHRADALLVVGRYVTGLRAEEAAQKVAKTKTASTGQRAPTAVVTHAGAAAPKGPPGGAAIRDAEAQFKKTGSFDDLKTLLASQRAARTAQAR